MRRGGHALVLVEGRPEIHTAWGSSRAWQPRTALRRGVDVHPLALHRGGTPTARMVHLHRRRPHAPRSLRPLPPSGSTPHSHSRLPNGASLSNHPLPYPHPKPCKTLNPHLHPSNSHQTHKTTPQPPDHSQNTSRQPPTTSQHPYKPKLNPSRLHNTTPKAQPSGSKCSDFAEEFRKTK